jgi:hypothetical protein
MFWCADGEILSLARAESMAINGSAIGKASIESLFKAAFRIGRSAGLTIAETVGAA